MVMPSASQTRPLLLKHASQDMEPRTLARRSYKSSKMNVDGGEGDGWYQQDPHPLTPDAMSTKLLSYASNIRRGRREKGKQNQNQKPGAATRSLLHSLRSESEALQQFYVEEEEVKVAQTPPEAEVVEHFRDALSKAVVSAIRSAADDGNYGLIVKIVDSVVDYAEAVSRAHGAAILDTRIFGEAITGLTKSNASQSKLKKMWSKFMNL